MEVNRNIKKPRLASRGFLFFEIFRLGYSRRLPIWDLARCGFFYWRLAPLPFTGRGWNSMRRDYQAAVGRAGSTLKKASAIAGLKGGASKRYFFISSFFVASFTFAFPILT